MWSFFSAVSEIAAVSGPSFVKNETATISWNETAAILNMAFSRKMNPETWLRLSRLFGHPGGSTSSITRYLGTAIPGTYGIQYLLQQVPGAKVLNLVLEY
jgi:hypothetical protein